MAEQIVLDGRASSALVEAQVMSESIRTIAEQLIEDCADNSFCLLEAIVACTMRLDAAVTPVIEEAQRHPNYASQ